ncbi:putative transcription factor C2C2-GATA family [Helianthus debilis subsp. tardiflorus]
MFRILGFSIDFFSQFVSFRFFDRFFSLDLYCSFCMMLELGFLIDFVSNLYPILGFLIDLPSQFASIMYKLHPKESVTFAETIGKEEKLCFDCKTSKTPLWRSGPAGPKVLLFPSLCNACGIRFRKKKSVSTSDKKKEKPHPHPSPSSSAATDDNMTSLSCRKREIGEDDLRLKVVLQRPRSPMKKVRRIERKFGEVEQAAYLLMCLSCG